MSGRVESILELTDADLMELDIDPSTISDVQFKAMAKYLSNELYDGDAWDNALEEALDTVVEV